MAIEIVTHDEDLQRMLSDLRQKSIDMTPVMREIAGYLGAFTKKVFNTEGYALLGKKWQPLKESTVKNKVKRGAWPRMILEDSYQLEQSIQQFYSDHEAGVSTNKVYAATHQFGSSESVSVPSHTRTMKKTGKTYTVKPFTMKRNIPARPFFGFSDKVIGDIMTIIMKYYQDDTEK